ncbi:MULTISPECIES: S-layer homology domain-containing protein [unclassified Sporosarcina]|uniref:S-layer homology domain-containing protein n=1 Tax=unclassified Sporosarcina TaxID=2647733 RepID=UPI000C16383A|nr:MULTISPECIES: S-layer homology domain-containing protein [unclassified Sporosarcina]PID06410.1 hypothetical protein CSV66_03685 [Sporosarcina sp. P30]PID09604.1 hypothetical protein CSV65_03685 [Sporosarcina sp. P31]PID13181.1 hypothetical protein CSV64_01720 [Sporosarcina sp. P32b]
MKNVIKVSCWTVLLLMLSFICVVPHEVAAKEFRDVANSHPNYAAIREMEKAGFISGYPDGRFHPNEPVSRKHVAVLMDRALGFKQPTSNKVVFKDVPKKHSYYTPIMKLYNEGIVGGSANGKFNPDASVTRVQMAKMLDLAFGLKISDTRWFNDLDSYHWGFTHVDALYSNGITSGDNGNFYPNKPVTRAHYAEFLSRSMKVGKSKPSTSIVTKSEAMDVFFRLPTEIDYKIYQSKSKKEKFSQARSEFLPYATERFADGLIKQEYPHLCNMCDAFIFPYVSFETQIRFDFEQPDSNTLKVHTILVHTPGAVLGGGFVDYIYKKEKDRWKIHDLQFTSPGKKNFELTMEEAKLIIEDFYGEVRYKSVSSMTSTNLLTNERYVFNQYKFSTSLYNEVTINSDDGWFE